MGYCILRNMSQMDFANHNQLYSIDWNMIQKILKKYTERNSQYKELNPFNDTGFFLYPLKNETSGAKWVTDPMFYKVLLFWTIFKYKVIFELSNE